MGTTAGGRGALELLSMGKMLRWKDSTWGPSAFQCDHAPSTGVLPQCLPIVQLDWRNALSPLKLDITVRRPTRRGQVAYPVPEYPECPVWRRCWQCHWTSTVAFEILGIQHLAGFSNHLLHRAEQLVGYLQRLQSQGENHKLSLPGH